MPIEPATCVFPSLISVPVFLGRGGFVYSAVSLKPLASPGGITEHDNELLPVSSSESHRRGAAVATLTNGGFFPVGFPAGLQI